MNTNDLNDVDPAIFADAMTDQRIESICGRMDMFLEMLLNLDSRLNDLESKTPC